MKIVLTGGGSAGHVTPNTALIPGLKEKGFEIIYIGSRTGMEKDIIGSCGVVYHGISSGKLRRYFDLKNLTDIFHILKGTVEAYLLLKKIRPSVVFSKGGFVVVPVAYAAFLHKIPVVIHESDLTPGLATRLIMPIARDICVSFPETLNFVADTKGKLTGSPIRAEVFKGEKEKGFEICGFDGTAQKPVVLITGGGQGSQNINRRIYDILPRLLDDFNVIHLCGRGNAEKGACEGYAPFEYVQDEMPHLLAAADVAVSRAGANTIFELLALRKPNLLIPLGKNASRGDQILNAASFEKQGFSDVLHEEHITADLLLERIKNLYENREMYVEKMAQVDYVDGVERVIDVIMSGIEPQI